MTIEGLRFELFVADVARSVRFYRELLGLEATEGVDPDGYVPIVAGALTIGLQRYANLPAGHHFAPERFDAPRGVGVEIVIEVDDVDAAYARAAASDVIGMGGRLESIRDRPWGLRDFRVVDPDGYYLRVTSHGGTTRPS